jgi:L-2-hydroxyglutarate oxidase LhgO
MQKKADFLIVGAGIVGVSIALELKKRYPSSSIIVLEKEARPGLHSSGRNSGVLHSGIYYPPESIKAKVCRQGSLEMQSYCLENGLPINRIGKILVPTKEEDAGQLDLLQLRANENGVDIQRLDESLLKKLEPNARSATGNAIFVPGTSVADPNSVMQSLVVKSKQKGIEILCLAVIFEVDTKNKIIKFSNNTRISYGHLINAAGLHADRIAHKFNVGRRYSLLPFKGIYWKLSPLSNLKINHLIYPVPDLRVPFLGVHTTTSVAGDVYFGPTAFPAFGRENYNGLQDVNFTEFSRITGILMHQIILGRDGFRRLALQEGLRYFKPWFSKAARQIVPNLKDADLIPCNKVGIRAQLYDMKDKKLVNDFLIEQGPSSTHILNAISPAWTSAFPFARFVIDNYIEKLNEH